MLRLRKSSEYKMNKPSFDALPTMKVLLKMLDKMETLKKILRRRYAKTTKNRVSNRTVSRLAPSAPPEPMLDAPIAQESFPVLPPIARENSTT